MHRPNSALSILLAAGLALAAATLSGVALAEGRSNGSPVELTEEGLPYRDRGPAVPIGKVGPSVEIAAQESAELEILLFVAPGPAELALPTAADVKRGHYPGIEETASRLREIERRNRQQGSLPEHDEKFQLGLVEVWMSDEDRAERTSLLEDLDLRLDAMRSEVGRAAIRRAGPGMAAVEKLIEALGGKVTARSHSVGALGAILPSPALEALASHPLVRRIVPAGVGEPDLDDSMQSTGHTGWHTDPNTPFCGGAYDSGIVDSGVQEDHPAFSGITFYSAEATRNDQSDGHGTHVTGIMASADGTYRGGAPCLDAVIWGRAGSPATSMGAFDTVASGLAQSPEAINYSWGHGWADGVNRGANDPATDDAYDATDQFFDSFVMNFDIMVSKSAGNKGWSDTLPTITHPGPAYNIMVVANMNDGGDTVRSTDVRASGSSVGPTLTGRRKPDISAPGSTIRSANAFWNTVSTVTANCSGATANNDFINCSGTSMAAPHVTSALVLMEDAGNHTPMAQKAVLINTADWWTSADTSGTADDGQVTSSSGPGAVDWDKSYGWGYLDMSEAFFNRSDYFVGSVVPRNDDLVEDDYKLYKGFMFVNEKATLVWERRSIYTSAAAPGTIYNLSDLNLRLYDETDGSNDDWDLDGDDNVHQVAATNTTETVIKVYSWSTSFDGSSSEPFALAVEEDFQEVSFPDSFIKTLNAPLTVQPGEEYEIEMRVRNTSDIASHSNLLDLTPPAGFTLLSANPVNVGSIAVGIEESAVWTVRAPAAPQSGVLYTVGFSHNSYSESYTAVDSIGIVEVVQDLTPPSPIPSWFLAPYQVSTDRIQMQSNTATDPNGPVEYYFDYYSTPTGGAGGSDSGWQTSTFYEDAALATNHQYCYRVRARDNPLTTSNVTAYSSGSCDYTNIQTPTGVSFDVVTTASIEARSTNTPSGLTRGSSGLVIYNNTRGTNSGWKTNNNDWPSSGLSPNTQYLFRAQARNGDGSGTPFSPNYAKYTLASQPAALAYTNVTDSSVRTNWSFNGNPANTGFFAREVNGLVTSGWLVGDHYTFNGLTCGQTYEFQVRARNGEFLGTAWESLGPVTIGFDSEGDGLPDCVDPDDDNDGALDTVDCSPLNPTLWSVPGEALGLQVTHAAGLTTLSWAAPGSPGAVTIDYDTVVSKNADNFATGAGCVEADGADQASTHGDTPDPGDAWFFLVRAENQCGIGSGGTDSSGSSRTVTGCP